VAVSEIKHTKSRSTLILNATYNHLNTHGRKTFLSQTS